MTTLMCVFTIKLVLQLYILILIYINIVLNYFQVLDFTYHDKDKREFLQCNHFGGCFITIFKIKINTYKL